MITVIIKDDGEPNVTQLTFENLYKELKDIYGSELLIKNNWLDLEDIKNRYVCFVESDCLVSEGYFKEQLDIFKEGGNSRTIGIMSSVTSINYWKNNIYGYRAGYDSIGLTPNRKPKSINPFTVQVAYFPGSVVRLSMLKNCFKRVDVSQIEDLVQLSSIISMEFWTMCAESKRNGHEVYINPEVTYLTTTDYVNDIGKFDVPLQSDVINLFTRSSI